MALDRQSLATYLDHTLLRPEATSSQILDACGVAVASGCATICVAPRHVARAAAALDPAKPTRVCTVVGFPTGAHRPEIKAAETRQAIADGAAEIDMVIALGALIEGDDASVRDDLNAVIGAARKTPGIVVKVILETALLVQPETIVRGCQLACEAGADFVKTSTGFGPGGATVEAVKLMRQTVGTTCQVKASGGIRTADQARAMIEAGATRLGTSSSPQILAQWEQST